MAANRYKLRHQLREETLLEQPLVGRVGKVLKRLGRLGSTAFRRCQDVGLVSSESSDDLMTAID